MLRLSGISSSCPATSMADSRLPTVSSRLPAAYPPRWGFFKGLLTGAVIEVPAIALGVWLLARMGIGDGSVPYGELLRMTSWFAGIAALFTAGGVGRLAAHASVDKIGGRRRAMVVAARAHAAAGAGLVLIATIPHGQLPEGFFGWLAILAMGGVVGAGCGAAIGVVCGGAAPVSIGDVLGAAIKRPSEVLRQLLDPEDLLKLGAAVRDRTTEMLVSARDVFRPAERPPTEADAAKTSKPAKTATTTAIAQPELAKPVAEPAKPAEPPRE
jgi:hypothetical protein